MSDDPNVLLVILDSVRAQNLSGYGHVNETTPFLDSFATERATLYEQARAPGSRSVTSHASIFSGLHVEEHGIVSAGRRLDPSASVFTQLREDGYSTGVFTENDWLTTVDVGLRDGFDEIVGARNVPFPVAVNPHEFVSNEGRGQYVEFLKLALGSDAPLRSLANGVATKVQSDYKQFLPDSVRASTPADVYVDSLLDWSDRQDGPWAACLNLMDAHIPYEPMPEYDRWGGSEASSLQAAFEDQKWDFNGGHRPWWQKKAVESLYDGAIRQMDAELERLVSALERRGELDDTLLVITSDHGEGFGEESDVRPGVRVAEHGVAIHDCLLHVPLIVRYPGQTESRQVDRPASLVEFPRVVDRVRDGNQQPAGFCPDGPVLATAVGLDEPLQERAGAYVDDLSPWTATSRAVFEDDGEAVVKYCTNQDRAATVVSRNAQTSYKVSDDGTEHVDRAFESIAELDVKTAGEDFDNLDDGTYQRLEDLGYV
ncbi:arylsulfatase [Haloarcula rubripromontorii]|uniref:Arylsulfatase n=1 Tax=Haloarcula rubripromontorii TaxID=1705562 RepID=A0A0N0U944_9EURY|nr:sulfatase [Haloarcula rubripromontorii]KOX92734.1 arylsulfatase [Haloarcula rubripromontorii]